MAWPQVPTTVDIPTVLGHAWGYREGGLGAEWLKKRLVDNWLHRWSSWLMVMRWTSSLAVNLND